MAVIRELINKKQNQSWSQVENSGILDIISNYNLAKVLTGSYKAGLISAFLRQSPIVVEQLTEFEPYLLGHLLRYFQIHGLLYLGDEGYYLTEKGKNLLSDESVAQLCFYSEAYDSITSNIDKFINREAIYGRDVMRDGKALGKHCDTLFKEYHTSTVLEAIDPLKCKKILDVGCGGGQFLIDVCQKSGELTGIGLDISEPAITYAKESAKSNQLDARIDFFVADAFNLSSWPEECFSADVLCASGVIHEHFRDGEEAVINILNKYAELLSGNFKAFILGEPEIRYDLVKSDSDLFLVHIFTAQGFPHHREEWLSLFSKTKLKCVNVYTRPYAGPRFNFFELRLK
jgi:SAM-dependent methyltransferase